MARRGKGPAVQTRWPGVSIAITDEGGRYYFDADAAQRAVDFFPTFLTHHKGEFAGQPFHLAAWQQELVVRPLFGWKARATGLRRFRTAYIEIPKKNGKSALSSGLGLYLLFCDGEAGAEVYCAAADKDQAAIVFDEAKAMVEDSEDLREFAEVYRTSIVYPATRSAFKVLSSEVRGKHGPNIHALIFDELHAQPDRELWDTLTKGVAARRQPLIVSITTAGDDPESICREQHDYAEKVISGVIQDETFLPVLFCAQEKDDWTDPAVWARVNPGYGITVKPEYLAAECQAAKNEPRKQNAFKRLHLDIWTQQHTVWIPVEAWDACQVPAVATGNPEGLVCVAGLDLSTKTDLTACVFVLRRPDPVGAPSDQVVREPADGGTAGAALSLNYTVEYVPFFWLPEDTLHERAKTDRIPYDLWRDQGLLRVTPGNVVDYDAIYAQLVEDLLPRYKVQEIGYDPWNATQFALRLQGAGYKVTEVRQGFQSLSEPSKLFEALCLSRRGRHDGHKVLRWCVSNLAVKEDASENIRPVKASKRHRIDGAVAAIIALGQLLRQPDTKAPAYQVYIYGGASDAPAQRPPR